MTYDPKLPPSCRAAQERMTDILREEDAQEAADYEIADLSGDCQRMLQEFEQKLNSQGYHDLALVAYQKKIEPSTNFFV